MPFVSLATLLLAAGPIQATSPATTPTPPATPPADRAGPPPAFIAASRAFGQCIGTEVGKIAPATTPEAGARQTVTACTAQRTAMDDQLEAWITGPTFPEADRDKARAGYREQIGKVEAQVAAGLRSGRTAEAPTP